VILSEDDAGIAGMIAAPTSDSTPHSDRRPSSDPSTPFSDRRPDWTDRNGLAASVCPPHMEREATSAATATRPPDVTDGDNAVRRRNATGGGDGNVGASRPVLGRGPLLKSGRGA